MLARRKACTNWRWNKRKATSSGAMVIKPFPEVYRLVEDTLPGVPAARIAMCGDTLHTDIMGASARGWRTVLVTDDGLFAGFDTDAFSRRSGLFADWRLKRI